MGSRRGLYKYVARKSEGKRPLGRTTRRWKNNIEMDFQEVEWDLNWIELAQFKDMFRVFVNELMNVRFP